MMLGLAVQSYLAGRALIADGGDSPSDVDPTTGKGPEWGEAAPVGLLVIVLMCIAVYFLVKSLNRNLKKVPKSFDPPDSVSVGATSKVADTATDDSGVVDGAPQAASGQPESPHGPG